MSNNPNYGRQSGDGDGPKMPRFNMNWLYTIIIVVLAYMFFTGGGSIGKQASTEASYSDFKKFVAHGYATKVVINKRDSELKMYVKPEHISKVFNSSAKQLDPTPYVSVNCASVQHVENFLETQTAEKKFSGDLDYEVSTSGFWEVMLSIGPTILFIAVWIFIIYRMSGGFGKGGGMGGIFNVGKSKAQEYNKDNAHDITFQDVAGQEGAKQEVQEIVEFLKNPKK